MNIEHDLFKGILLAISSLHILKMKHNFNHQHNYIQYNQLSAKPNTFPFSKLPRIIKCQIREQFCKLLNLITHNIFLTKTAQFERFKNRLDMKAKYQFDSKSL